MMQHELLKQVTYDFAESEPSIFSPYLESSKEWAAHLPLAEPNLTWSRAEMPGEMETGECVGFKLVTFPHLIGCQDQTKSSHWLKACAL